MSVELPRLRECCPPLLRETLSAADAEQLAGLLKVLADPARLRLLSLVAAHPGQEACVCELTEPLGLSQPTVSHHLKVLHMAGLLGREQRGIWVYYRLLPGRLEMLQQALAPDAGEKLETASPAAAVAPEKR